MVGSVILSRSLHMRVSVTAQSPLITFEGVGPFAFVHITSSSIKYIVCCFFTLLLIVVDHFSGYRSNPHFQLNVVDSVSDTLPLYTG